MPSEARWITKMKARYGWDHELEGEGSFCLAPADSAIWKSRPRVSYFMIFQE